MYLSPEALSHHIGLADLAVIVGGRVNADIDEGVLLSALKNDDLAHYLNHLVADVQNAMVHINMRLFSAEKLVDAYVSVRYKTALTPTEIEQSPLPALVANIVKHDLMLNTDEDTRLVYKQTLEQLKLIANGKMNLGTTDPAPTSSSKIATSKSASAFDFSRFG